MAHVTRRKLLKLSGAGAVAAKTGGLAAILASGRAPAYAQATTVHWLRWNDFVPASDQLLRREILPEAEKALGIKVNFETVNGNDLQPRITSAIQSGAGPDLIMLFNNHPHLYAASVVDLSDVAEEIGKSAGRLVPGVSRATATTARSGSRCRGRSSARMNAYRKSWFDEVGYNKFPRPGTSTATPARSSRPRAVPSARRSATPSATRRPSPIRCCGRSAASEVDDGGKVAINSKETIESVKLHGRPLEGRASTRAGSPGTTPNNNRAFLSGTIATTLNGASIYIESTAPARPVQDREGRAAQGRHPARAAAEGAGRPVRHAHLRHRTCMPSYSKNQKADEGLPALAAHARELRRSGSIRRKASRPAPRTEWEKNTMWEERPGHGAVPRRRPARRAARPQGPAATPAPARCCRNT